MPKSLSVKNIPNLCRKLAHRYMQAFYTDWVYKVFWHFLKMYPICVECLHIGICKHSTQIGYIRLTPIPFLHKLGTFSKMCPICVECLRINYNYHSFLKIFPNLFVFSKNEDVVVFSLRISLIQTKNLIKQMQFSLAFSKIIRFFKKRRYESFFHWWFR